jgi:hypothetical protein
MEVGWDKLVEEIEDVDVTKSDRAELEDDTSLVDLEGVGVAEVGFALVLVLAAADVLGSAEVCLIGAVLLLGVLSAVAAGTGSANTVLGGFVESSSSFAGPFFCRASMRRPS